MKHIYSWRPDPPDRRDFPYLLPSRLIAPPSKVDLRRFCSLVEDQGNVGSCYGNATAGWYECMDTEVDGKFTDVSRLFIYYTARAIAGDENEDAGAYLRDGIKALHKWGACDESVWPYDTRFVLTRPSEEAYRDAMKRRIVAYYRAYSFIGVKSALAEGIPVIFGFRVYESFESDEVTRTGVMPVPKDGEEFMGGHAVIAVGYDDAKKHLIVRNSWGKGWGDGGYFYMPYEFAGDPLMADDYWVILGTGLKFDEEPANPLPSDTVWYVPIISIIRILWERFWGKK